MQEFLAREDEKKPALRRATCEDLFGYLARQATSMVREWMEPKNPPEDPEPEKLLLLPDTEAFDAEVPMNPVSPERSSTSYPAVPQRSPARSKQLPHDLAVPEQFRE